MTSWDLRVCRFEVLLGFVLAGFSPLWIAVNEATGTGWGAPFFNWVSCAGFAFLGWASWSLLRVVSSRNDDGLQWRSVLRGFGAACLIFGAAYLGLIVTHAQYDWTFRHVVILETSFAGSLVGFGLAAHGFWKAGSVVATRRADIETEADRV